MGEVIKNYYLGVEKHRVFINSFNIFFSFNFPVKETMFWVVPFHCQTGTSSLLEGIMNYLLIDKCRLSFNLFPFLQFIWSISHHYVIFLMKLASTIFFKEQVFSLRKHMSDWTVSARLVSSVGNNSCIHFHIRRTTVRERIYMMDR